MNAQRNFAGKSLSCRVCSRFETHFAFPRPLARFGLIHGHLKYPALIGLVRSKILMRAHHSDGNRFELIYVRHGGIATSQHNWAFRGRHHLWNLSGAPVAGSCAYRLAQQLEISECRRFGIFVEYRVSGCTHTQPWKPV